MKTLRTCLVVLLALCMFAGCTNRSNNNNTTENSTPGIISEAEDMVEDLVSDVEDGVSRLEDDLHMEESRLEDMDGDYDADAEGNVDDESRLDDDMDLEESYLEESIAAAMSTDFAEIGALDAEKKGWGSGGPTDDSGRPNGCTVYQEKYGKYDALFIAPSSNNIYLTFDEGYENGYTPAILDILKEKEAKAVFFITLDYAQRQPELVQRMIDEGHTLGNHSFKHLSFPEMPLEQAAKDIMTLHNYVQENFGYEMTLFRPPMGEFSEQSLALAQSLGYKSIFWSFAYKDYDVDNQPLTIEALDSITNKSHPGAIYLLHAVSKTNTEVLDEAIDNFREQGYTVAAWDL